MVRRRRRRRLHQKTIPLLRLAIHFHDYLRHCLRAKRQYDQLNRKLDQTSIDLPTFH